MTEAIRVDVWSDVACPWCYIGKRRLEHGIDAFVEGDSRAVEVEFHSFQLDPGVPEDFQGSAADYLARHKGIPESRAAAMQAHVTQVAAGVGLTYDFARQKPANTLAAHQVLHLAKAHGVQSEMKERLLSAHFTEGLHIGRTEVLADVAADVGISREDVETALASGSFVPAVEADIDRARALGIHGVPFFVINGRFGVSGAQPAETFTRVLEDIASGRAG